MVISRGHLDSPGGLLLLPVDISVAGREKDEDGWSAKCQKERLFSGQVEPGTEVEDPTEKNQRLRSRLLSSWVVNHTVNHQVKRAVEPRTGGLNPGCQGALARRARRLDRSQKAGNITRRVGTSPIGVEGPTRTREHARPGDEREAEFAPEDFLCPNQRFGSGPLIA